MTTNSTQLDGPRLPLWISIVVILGALLLTIGAVISKVAPLMLTNGGVMTIAVRVYADYTFARDLPLAFMLFLLLALKARRMLAGMMALVALVQVLDLVNDLARGEFLLVPITLLLTVVFVAGASRLLGQSIWQVNAWREKDLPQSR